MKILLEVKDESAPFFLKLFKNFKNVKAKPLSNSKAEILEGLKQAVDEVNLIKNGRLKGIPAKELLNEL